MLLSPSSKMLRKFTNSCNSMVQIEADLIVIFMLVIFSGIVHSETIKQEEPACEPNGNILDLSDSRLRDMPSCKDFSMSGQYIKTLELRDNYITSFQYVQLNEKFPNILYIYLPGNQINSLDEAGNLTTKVQTLDLGWNIIDKIHPNALENFKHLQKLYLNDNRIKHLSVGVFKSLSKLKVLYLSNNKLLTLDYYLFSPLQVLNELYMSNNTIQDLNPPIFEWQPSLCKLNISNNPLVRIPPLLRCGMMKDKCYIDFTNNPTICFCQNEIYRSKCKVYFQCRAYTVYSKVPKCKPIKLNIFYYGSTNRASVGCEASGYPPPAGLELIVGTKRYTSTHNVIIRTIKDISLGDSIFCSAWNVLEHKWQRAIFNLSVAIDTGKSQEIKDKS